MINSLVILRFIFSFCKENNNWHNDSQLANGRNRFWKELLEHYKLIKMETINKKIATKLNKLIAVNMDSKMIYENAAKKVRDLSLTQALLHLANERESFIELLKMQVVNLGELPIINGTSFIELRLLRMDLKSILLPDNMKAIVKECITSETLALKEYKEILNEDFIAESIEFILDNQLHGIESTLNNIRILEYGLQYQ